MHHEARLCLEMEPHRNIVALLYCVVAKGEFLMFHVLVEDAETLSQKIKSRSIYDAPLRKVRVRIIGLIKDIAEALRHLHSIGIMHQDVSGMSYSRDTISRG
jgi:serine/threonine protein kinase